MTPWQRLKQFAIGFRQRREENLDRELQAHLDLEAEEAEQLGLSPQEARYAAHRALGSAVLVKEDVRAAWRWALPEQFVRDVRYSLRQIGRNPGFAALAVLTLALGVGANTAMFSAVDAVLIRALPYTSADRLVMIWEDLTNLGFAKGNPAPGTWQEWRRSNDVFTDIAASESGQATLSDGGDPEQVPARKVTANFWTVLGAQPALGRAFTEDEDAHGALVAVISYRLWQRRFGGSKGILGHKIGINDHPYEVIGVMPRDFYFRPARDIDIWTPAAFPSAELSNFGDHYLECVARLKPGVTLRPAGESLRTLTVRIAEQHGYTARTPILVPLREELAGKTQTSLIVLLCASATILLISCVNLANLLLSRGAVRRREVAVRAALGAGRARLIVQLLIESLVLAGFGAVAGVLLALPVMKFLETLVPETMGAVHLSLDWRVLAFSAAIAVAAGLTFGLAPAVGGSRVELQTGLRDGGRGSAGTRSRWFQDSLILAETALAVVLLTGGALLLQTFRHLRQIDLGIRTEKLLTVVTPLFRYREFDRRVAFVNAMLEKIRAVPGVVSAGAISQLPLTSNGGSSGYTFASQTPQDARGQDALYRVVTRDYFATMGARLREGRFFDASDRATKNPVAIVNETLANRNFPGRSVLGARFQFGRTGPAAYWYTVVGVVKEIRDRGLVEELKPAIYLVHEQADQSWPQPSGLVIRTSIDPVSIVPSVRQAIWSVDRNEPLTHVQTVDDLVARELSEPSQDSALLAAFAILALALASVGLYGVLSHSVAQRTNEIGVRMALGATPGSILLTFGRHGLALTLAGLGMGLLLAMATTRLMRTLLYGFQPDYPPVVAAVSGILLVIAVFACLIPARRASRIDPIAALRHE